MELVRLLVGIIPFMRTSKTQGLAGAGDREIGRLDLESGLI